MKVRLFGLAAAATLLGPVSLAHATGIDFTTLQLNADLGNPPGVPSATANDLRLIDGNGGEASSAFLQTPISSASSFISSFDFTLVANPSNPNNVSPQADGLAFLIQSVGPTALGGGGGGIGASGITSSVGIGFQSWTNNHATIFTGGDAYGGTQPAENFSLGQLISTVNNPNVVPVNVDSDAVHVSMQYSNGLLSYIAQNFSTGETITDSLAFDLSTLGPNVWFGFTGGSGLGYSFEDVTNWDVTITPLPATWTMMLAGLALFGFAGYRGTKRKDAAFVAA